MLARGLADVRRPGRAASGACRSRARGSAPACSRPPARRCPAARAADLLALAAHARQLPTPTRSTRFDGRACGAPRRRDRRARARRAVARGRARPFAALDALGRGRRPGRGRAARRAAWPRPRRSGPRRTRGARTCSGPRRPTSPRGRGAARRGGRAARARRRRPALLGGAGELLEALGAVEVREGDAGRGGVLLADPLAVRARRFRAVFVCGLQDAEFPRRPTPEPFLDDDARADLARGDRARAAAPRGRARPRALPVLRVRLAAGGGAVPLLPLLRRGGRPARALAVPRRRARAVHRCAVGAARAAPARPRHVAAVGGADAARAAPGARRAAVAARPAAARGRPRPTRSRRCSPPTSRVRPRAGGVRRPAACAGSSTGCCRPRRTEPDPEAMRRGSLAHAAFERVWAGCASAPARPCSGPPRCPLRSRRSRA